MICCRLCLRPGIDFCDRIYEHNSGRQRSRIRSVICHFYERLSNQYSGRYNTYLLDILYPERNGYCNDCCDVSVFAQNEAACSYGHWGIGHIPGDFRRLNNFPPHLGHSPAVKPNISELALTRTPDPNRSTAINFVHVIGRSLYIVD